MNVQSSHLSPSSCSRVPASVLGLLAASTVLGTAATTFNIDFRNGQWTQGGTTAAGWRIDPTTSRPYTSGTAAYDDANVTLLVQSSFAGTASRGAQNLTLDPPAQTGFAFQNNGGGDLNRGTTLDNYQRIDFTFSAPIILDTLMLEDIDTQNRTGNTGWRDATTIQLWRGAPTLFGSGINPDISLNTSTNLSIINDPTRFSGVPYVYATTRGNTTGNDPRSTANFSSAEAVDGFSIFLWNQQGATASGNHGISLRASGNSIAVVPEPSVASFLGLSLISMLAHRKRK